MSDTETKGYLHGFTDEERDRLYHQARLVEHRVHDRLPYRRARRLLEVGCGVGAQTEILLRRFPDLHVTGIDSSANNLAAAGEHLAQVPWAPGRYELREVDAAHTGDAADTYDAAFVAWVLEHVADPAQVLAEVQRVLQPGAPIVCTEVHNATFYLHPASPHLQRYWAAFNEYQVELGGDPYVGAKLGNLLLGAGFTEIETEVNTFHLDARTPEDRHEFITYWSGLLLSGAPTLLAAGKLDQATVDGTRHELAHAANNPETVFYYSFIQARARAR